MKIVIVYNPHSGDSKLAAVMIDMFYSNLTISDKHHICLMPVEYSDFKNQNSVLFKPSTKVLIEGTLVFLVGICPSPQLLNEFFGNAESVTVFEYHDTPMDQYGGTYKSELNRTIGIKSTPVTVYFNKEESAASMVFEHFFIDRVSEVSITSDWRGRLEIASTFAKDYVTWAFHQDDTLAVNWLLKGENLYDIRQWLVADPEAYEEKLQHYRSVMQWTLQETERLSQDCIVSIIGHREVDVHVPSRDEYDHFSSSCVIANVPRAYASAVCHELLYANAEAEIAIVWFQFSKSMIEVSVRSRPENQALARRIAESYGGGGLDDAAGFYIPTWKLPLLLNGKLRPKSDIRQLCELAKNALGFH